MKPQVRVLILVPAIPGFFFLAFQIYSWYLHGLDSDFSLLAFGYGLASCYLVYLAVTGKQPVFLTELPENHR
jgi:hypothetical protein